MVQKIEILLVEENAAAFHHVQCLLKQSSTIQFELTHSASLGEAVQKLQSFPFEIVLLNLDLPDCNGLNTFRNIQNICSEIPIVVVADELNADLALNAIRLGAEDFLMIHNLDAKILIRTIIFAIERHQFRNNVFLQRSLALFALDRLTCGVILIGPLCSVVSMNRFAQAVLSERDGLLLENGFVRACSKEENQAFQKSVFRILNANSLSQTMRGGHLTISRNERQPLGLLIAPLILRPMNRNTSCNFASIFVSDPERAGKTIEEVLRRNHTLTKAEARLSCLILQGMSVADCSVKLGITINTVRDHLKKIFLKTGSTRQADLVRILLTANPASEE